MMNKKELFYFVGKCLMLDDDPEFKKVIIDKIDSDEIDWLNFTAICSNHLILPVIFLKFRKHGVIEYLPDELQEYLREVYELNHKRNNSILEQLREITVVLNKNEIFPLFLKGAGNLLDGVYEDIGERILADIDFWVEEKDYLPAARVLEADGYAIVNPFDYDFESLNHYPMIMKPGAPVHVEIHRLISKNRKNRIGSDIVARERKNVATQNGCFVLSDKYKVIHNFIHSQLDHVGHQNGIVSFRDIYDLYLISKRITLVGVLSEIKSKRKAEAYFVMTGKAFGLDGSFFQGQRLNLSSWVFLKKHDLNLRSPVFYRINNALVTGYHRLFVEYWDVMLQSFHSEKLRRSVLSRLSDRKWYAGQFKIAVSYFKRGK